MAEQDVVLVEQNGPARVITFNRPEALNSMGGGLPQRVLEELDRADVEDEARVVILTGAGRGFCSGGDIKGMYRSRVQGEGGGRPQAVPATRVFDQGAIPQKIRKLSKPVIAAVNGDAAGAGCDIALSSDIRIASDRARFGEVFARMGLLPDNGAMYLLPRLVGMARATEMILTAEMFTAEQIADWGALNAVVPHEELMTTALDYAERIASNPPLALAMSKWGLQRAQHVDFETSFDWVNYSMNLLRASPEHKDAVTRFVEERAARRASSD
jgi:2-(1,2-epoxy-1,2-dihydrophenyl)acetyl-CoA isomerase